jgi:adenine deaminase
MSARPCEEVAEREAEVNRFVRDMGCPLPAPFMTLSFQSLLVVPQLKLGDRGLFDSVRQRFVSPVISSAVPR